MNDEKLIELVREYPVLYDLSHAKYMDSNYKYNIWKKLATELKEEVASCKSRWNNIRDNYRKSLKKTVTKSGASAKKIKLYKYSEQLGFLKKFFEVRNTKGNIESQDEQEGESEEKQNNEEFENIEEDANDHDPEVSTETDADADLPKQLSPAPPVKKKIKTTTNAMKSTKKRTSMSIAQPTASSALMEYLIKKKETEPSNTNITIDAVDGFLIGIGATLKTLPSYLLNLAKSEIFATAQKYEMQMLQQHSDLRGNTSSVNPLSSTCSVVSTPMTSPIEDSQQSPEYQDIVPLSEQSPPSLQNYYSQYYAD